MLELVRIPGGAGHSGSLPASAFRRHAPAGDDCHGALCRPAVLIADEPTTALDVTIQAQILQLIKVLQQEMEMGVISSPTIWGVVADIADRVLVMHRAARWKRGPG